MALHFDRGMTIKTVTFAINGETVTLTKGTDGVYSATVTAPTATSGSNNSGNGPGVGANAKGKGYYPGVVKVTDDAGNTTTVDTSDATWGNVLKLKVLEKTKPTAAITSPGTGSYITNSKPAMVFTVTDAGSGVNPAKCYIKIDSGDATALPSSAVSVSGNTATCTYTPTTALSEGQHTIQVYGYDYDGNQSDAVSSTFTVDTVPPTLNITAPADGLKTNASTVTVTGTTNDVTSSPVTIKITCGGKTYNPAVGTGGAFSQVVDLSEGANTITVTATDSAGKVSTVTRTVTVDTGAPVITKIELTPNPVDGGKTYVIKVTATD